MKAKRVWRRNMGAEIPRKRGQFSKLRRRLRQLTPKRVYRKRQWTRQAARKFAKVAKRWARKKPKWHKSLSNVADLASAYAIGKMLQVRLLNSAGVEIGWRDEPNPFKWINEMPDALRVKPKEGHESNQ